MKALGEILKLAAGYLEDKKVSRPKRIAEDLLAHILQSKRLDLYLQFDRPLNEDELSRYRSFLARLAKGEPLEYILEEVEFYGCHLKVTQRVLIPRPETELLLDKICKKLEGKNLENKAAWDLCTGSGCLGLALKKKFPTLLVTLSDLSPEALEVAKINACLNNLDVNFLEGDLLTPFYLKKADLVIANPPYISQEAFDNLDPGVRDFEPKMALLAGKSGLEFYQRLAGELPLYLNPRARVFFEIGFDQGEEIMSIFSDNCWSVKFFERDFSLHDRFFFLEFE
ncbi:MAG: peptide chain release factor N(5)-glutamine methyltransferase [Chlamydiota bacterium]